MRYPWLFILLILAVIAITARSLRRFYAAQRKTKKSAMIAHSKKIKALPEYEKARKRYRFLLILAAICFVIAIASTALSASRPISVEEISPDYETRDIMLCLDVSGSQMGIITEVLNYFSNTKDLLKGQRIGVGAFAKRTAIFSPLTNDYEALDDILKEIAESWASDGTKSLAGVDGTGSTSAIGDGIINCASGFDKLTEDGRAQSMIVATDGAQNDGKASITEAAYYLARYNITLYVIDTVPNSGIMKRETAETLENAAGITGGLFYNLKSLGINESQAANDIMRQEAAKHDGITEFVKADSPRISTIAALCSAIVLMLIIWRLKL